MGMAFSLTPDDHIFGSHRSHGEILAKGFAAIRQLERSRALDDHGDLRGRRAAPSGRARLQRVGQRAGAPILHLRRLLRDLRARHRLQPRAGRVDARVLRALRDLPEQRDRRRLGLDRAWRRALQARQPQAGHRRRQYRRCVVRLRSGLGGNHVLRDGPVPAPVGSVARRRPAHPVQLHEQLLRHGRAAVRRDDGGAAPSPASAPASIPIRCTRSVSTVTIRCPSSMRSAGRRDILQAGGGPVLLETITYRISGHSPSDASSYRSKEEIERWQQADSIRAFRAKLIDDAASSRKRRWTRHAPSIEATIVEMLAARGRSRRQPARRRGFRARRLGDVLEPAGREIRRRASPSSCRRSPTTPACSRFAARFARRRTTASPSRR